MKLFKNYLLEQLLENILLEMPHINLATSKENYSRNTEQVPSLLSKIHSSGSSVHIGNDNYYNHFNGSHIYYHLHDGKPREYSVITNKHEQTMTSKSDGDSKHIHSFMKHHVDTHGQLSSSTSQTEGSKKLWHDFIKHNPNHTYKASVNNKESDLDTNNLNKYWSTKENDTPGQTKIKVNKNGSN